MLDPSHNTEIYKISQILGNDDYHWSSTDNFALQGHIQCNFTIYEKAFQSTVNNIAGKVQPVAGLSMDNGISWLTELHLNKQLDHAGVVELKNPLNLIRILQEDGASYIFGTVNHESKDDMSLTRLINPTPTQQEGLSFISLSSTLPMLENSDWHDQWRLQSWLVGWVTLCCQPLTLDQWD